MIQRVMNAVTLLHMLLALACLAGISSVGTSWQVEPPSLPVALAVYGAGIAVAVLLAAVTE